MDFSFFKKHWLKIVLIFLAIILIMLIIQQIRILRGQKNFRVTNYDLNMSLFPSANIHYERIDTNTGT